MITFSRLGNYGRLGNAMFQYAAIKALACKLNCEAKIPPDLFDRLHHGQKCLLQCFNLHCETYSLEELNNLGSFYECNYCDGGYYTEQFWNCKKNTNLFGYFESELYFQNIKNKIKEEYQLKDEYNNYCLEYIKNIRNVYPEHQIIGINIRRGDYLNPENGAEFITTNDYTIQYLKKAFENFNDNEKKLFLVFTGGSTENNNRNEIDIEWCKNNIMNFNINKENEYIFLFCECNDTILDFGIMTLCDHLILNSTSTLGWWAAYLNKNEQKRIVVNNNLEFKSKETFWLPEYIQI
jgi:hypothetical protein